MLVIARAARQAGLVAALRAHPTMPLQQLIGLVSSSKYAEDLERIPVAELGKRHTARLWSWCCDDVEDVVLRIFYRVGGEWLSAGFFVRYLGLERWTAQKICGELAECGLIERRGRTSGTRYRYVASSS